MKSTFLKLTMAVAGVGLFAGGARADHDWPQWRGPNFDGSSQATNLPDKIDKDKAAWTTHLPGSGNGTPVITGDRVFITVVDPQSSKLMGVCISRTDGRILWQKEIGEGITHSDRNNAASPSAVTDGKSVYFLFSTGDLAAFDVQGKPLWQRNLQKDHGTFNVLWIYSSSPLLYKGKLYVQVLHRNVPAVGLTGGSGGVDSYLLAIDPQTGKDIWKVARPSDAVAESRESYATPTPLEFDGRTEITLIGGDCVTAHDADTGKELWRAGGWNQRKLNDRRVVPSTVVDARDGLVFACAPKGWPVMAIHDGGQGDVTAAGFAWKSDGRASGITSDVPVPLFYKDHLYVLNGDRKTLFDLEPTTGKIVWKGDLGGDGAFKASPSAADGKIYLMNENGEVFVVAADEFRILSTSSLGEKPSRGSIALADEIVIVRAGDMLYGFRK